MTENLNKAELLTTLKSQAQSMGLHVVDESGDGFRAEQENIVVKWLLGQRKVLYRLGIRLSEGDHVANFREMVREKSWGLLPPTLTIEKTSIRGTELSGTHEERSPVGGGKVDFGRAREAVKKMVGDAGWTFHLEAGRAP